MSMTVENLHHSYGTHLVLNDAFVKCSKGEVLGILGRNGSGKSTLFKLITGMLDSATMSIRIDGMPARTETIYRHVAYLPQESFLPRELKVEACIRLFLQSESQRYFVSDDKRVKELSASRIGRLSGGERRYIELLLILARDQDFLLLDEPFAELDPIYRERAVGLIKDASLKKGIILTDQDYRSVLSASTSLALLSNCNLKHIGSGIELIQYGYISGQ